MWGAGVHEYEVTSLMVSLLHDEPAGAWLRSFSSVSEWCTGASQDDETIPYPRDEYTASPVPLTALSILHDKIDQR